MNSQYIDILWLKTFGINVENALDYFCCSPFYDVKANNEVLRAQGLSAYSPHLQTMTGLEFLLEKALTQEPHLFVFRKVNRVSAKSTETLQIFYCLDGLIMQCPSLFEILRTRISLAADDILLAYQELQPNTEKVEKEPRDSDFGQEHSVKSTEDKICRGIKRKLTGREAPDSLSSVENIFDGLKLPKLRKI